MGNNVLALIFPAGKIVYNTRQTKAMTTGTDKVTLEVPAKKRWLLHYGWLRNESTQTIVCSIGINDTASVNLGFLVYDATLADNGEQRFPIREGTQSTTRWGSGAFPFLLDSGMELEFTWGSNGSKADQGYWYAMITEL